MPKINQEEYEVLKELDDKRKWIARDGSGELYAYEEKPKKFAVEWVGERDYYLYRDETFQFIQWEDENPYNIAELIEEYEDYQYTADWHAEQFDKLSEAIRNTESEDTEVKKDLSWFKEQLDDIEMNTPRLWSHDSIWMLDRVNELLNQLSEPETLSEEWIEEYQGEVLDEESGETEVKDKKWLQDSITKVMQDLFSTSNPNYFDFEKADKQMRELVDQLDEPEVLSQEWIDDNKDVYLINDTSENAVPDHKLKNLLVPKHEITEEQAWEKISEYYPVKQTSLKNAFEHFYYGGFMTDIVVKKPTIPEFVAEFLDGKEEYALYELLDNDFIYDEHDKLAKWLYDNDEDTNKERELSLVLAQRYGYEVETEQRYYVVNNDNRMMLVRMMDGKTITEADPFKLEDMYEAEKKSHQLTEQEIKDYDVRFWAFAEEV